MTARERQAAINELRDVWTGKTDLSKASAQVRLNWEVVRDCIDRFANRDNPNTAQVNSWWWPFSKLHTQMYRYTSGNYACILNVMFCLCYTYMYIYFPFQNTVV